MSTFDKREQDLKTNSRMTRSCGSRQPHGATSCWASGLQGFSDTKATKVEEYAKEVVRLTSKSRVTRTFSARSAQTLMRNNVDQSDHQIRRTMDELMATAVDQLQNEG
jgi:hypothetical protein